MCDIDEGESKLDESEVFKQLSEADWNTIGRQLAAFAVRCARWYSWQSGDPNLLAEGNLPEDIAQKVIEKAFSRERRWNPDKIALLPWLFGQVRSEMDNLYKSLVRQRESPIIPLNIESEEEEGFQDQVELRTVPDDIFSNARPITPEAALLRKEYIEERESRIFAAVRGAPELEQLLDAIIELHEVKPQELSVRLNVPVNTVYQRLRKMHRRIESQDKDE